MHYPTLEQYNEALQYPKTAFFDPELKNGIVATSGLGLPQALCGGFALTYCVQSGSKKYAVRCFHKQSNNIERRYEAISNKITAIQSPFFVSVEFQSSGVNVAGKKAPIVKMAWASGKTLGEFLESNYQSKAKLQSLNSSLRSLAVFLESEGIAHGDIQPDNVMVANDGKSIQLIDYDGMYVDEIKALGTVSGGLPNFQHPKRDQQQAWNARLDRFSFIELNLALRILESHPHFWDETKSEATLILFNANDYADPSNSQLFKKIFGIHQFSDDAKNFAAICRSPFDKIPTLEDFIAKKNIPQVSISISTQGATTIQPYRGAFPVLNADDYELCFQHVGDRVELIGKIVGVKEDKTRGGKPFIFINFGDWRGKTVKVSIWSEGLAALSHKPDSTWEGKWLTITGLMEPPYHDKTGRYNYSHLSITITQANQLHILQEPEARYRLGGSTSTTNMPKQPQNTGNQKILEGLKGSAKPQPRLTRRASSPHVPPASNNQNVLQAMKQKQGEIRQIPSQPILSNSSSYQKQKARNKSGCFIASAVYGPSALETNILREWRDHKLLLYWPGRMITNFYYFVSPSLSKLIVRHEPLKKITRSFLDYFIARISR